MLEKSKDNNMLYKAFKYSICMVITLLLLRTVYLAIVCYTHDYNDKVWQPYLVGDTMFFSNNKGDSTEWNIFEIRNGDNFLSPVFFMNPLIISSLVGTNDYSAVIHIRTYSGQKSIYFHPEFKGRNCIEVREYEKRQKNVSPSRYRNMDILKIIPHEKVFRKEPFLDSIYWSSQYGYIKVFYSDGEIWELKSFKRNGEIVYELNN